MNGTLLLPDFVAVFFEAQLVFHGLDFYVKPRFGFQEVFESAPDLVVQVEGRQILDIELEFKKKKNLLLLFVLLRFSVRLSSDSLRPASLPIRRPR